MSVKSKRIIDAKLITRTDESLVAVKFNDGNESSYHGIWLRDHCKCSKCHHSLSKQRLLDSSKIPISIKPSKLKIIENVLHIIWPDGHESHFESPWLHYNSYYPKIKMDNLKRPRLWGKELINDLPIVSYADVMKEDGDGLKRWLENIVLDSF